MLSSPLHVGLVALVAATLLTTACWPDPDPPPDDEPPEKLEVDVHLVADAPAPADDPPLTDGLLPRGVRDDVQVFDLGLVAITDGRSADIVLDATSGVGGFEVLVYGHEGSRVILERVLDPTGGVVVSDVDPDDLPATHVAFARGFPAQMFSINRVLGSVESGSFLVPNTPRVSMKKGAWRMNVGQYVVDVGVNPPTKEPLDRPVRVVVLVRPPVPDRGALQIAVHLTGAHEITAANAATDPFLQEALAVVRSSYEAVGVELSDVAYVDVSSALRVIELEQDQCEGGQVADLFRAGAPPDGHVPLFLIERFACQFGEIDVGDDIGGLAGAIPGPAFVAGTQHAGTAIATDFPTDAAELGLVMAHELGHYLGLYHTRESGFFGDQPITDEIPDTAEDPDGARANLMYFATESEIALTGQQGRMLRTNPWVAPLGD